VILFFIQTLLIIAVFIYSNYKVIKEGKVEYAVIFLIFYLPVYFTYQSLIFQQTHSVLLINLFRYLKEITILIALMVAVGGMRNVLDRPLNLTKADTFFGLFTLLSVVYAILPIGDTGLIERILYLKKIILPSSLYFLGRIYHPSSDSLSNLFKSIIIVAVLAFSMNLFEFVTSTHYHTRIGWASYDYFVNDVDPSGHYGIGWNFEIGPNNPRFAAFFANTLEAGVSSLFAFAIVVPMFLFTRFKSNQMVFGTILIMIVFSTYFAFSRSSLASIFLEIVFVAFLLRYFKLLIGAGLAFVFIMSSFVIFGSDDLRYLIIDTITFRQLSSFGHLVEWLRAIQNMIDHPFGIGLGTSGNIGAMSEVAKGDSIGGENQYFIYGVQLGVIGMMLYIFSLFYVIRHSYWVFRNSIQLEYRKIAMSAAIIKVGLLLPLFTSNAETFQYVSFLSWWLSGLSMSIYSRMKTSIS
jgi:hypothetical protein